jgi:hypothetical protein
MPKTKLPKSAIASSLLTPDDSVAIPSRQNPASFQAQLMALAVDETAAKVTRIDNSHSLFDIQTNLSKWREDMRNAVASSVRNAKVKLGDGYQFQVEVSDLQTTAANWYIVVLVTRTE